MLRPCLFIASMLVGCTTSIAPDDNAPSHHSRDGTFTNSDGTAIENSLRDLIKWQREAPEVIPLTLASVPPQLEKLASPGAAQITWIGHSTFLLQIDGLNILTDPVFSDRASPVSFAGPMRTTPPAIDGGTIAAYRYCGDLTQPLRPSGQAQCQSTTCKATRKPSALLCALKVKALVYKARHRTGDGT